MISNEDNQVNNKKVSKESKRCKFWVDLPNEQFKNELRIFAHKKGTTIKKLTEKIFLNYAIQERVRQQDRSVNGLKDSVKEPSKLSKEQLTNMQQILFKAYQMAVKQGDTEIIYLYDYIKCYIEDFDFRNSHISDDFTIEDFDKFD